MSHALWWQHNSSLVFSPHAFKSTQQCLIIQIICRCKDDKANTCHVMWLIRVVLFEDCAAFLIIIFTLSLKKENHGLQRRFSNGSTLLNIHELLTFRNPSNQKKLSYRLLNLHGEHHLWNLYEGLSLLMFQINLFSTWYGKCFHCPDLNLYYCLQNVLITKVRGWMGTMFQNLDPWLPNIFPAISKMKGKVYANKMYHYLLMTRLVCVQYYGLNICVTIMSLCCYINHVLFLTDPISL